MADAGDGANSPDDSTGRQAVGVAAAIVLSGLLVLMQ